MDDVEALVWGVGRGLGHHQAAQLALSGAGLGLGDRVGVVVVHCGFLLSGPGRGGIVLFAIMLAISVWVALTYPLDFGTAACALKNTVPGDYGQFTAEETAQLARGPITGRIAR